MKSKGRIQSFKELRGFGIIWVDFRTRLYFHVSEYLGETQPVPDQEVEFEIIPPKQPGLLCQAIKVAPVVPVSKSETVLSGGLK